MPLNSSLNVYLLKKGTTSKKMSSVVLSTILIELITCLMIFYFFNLQIEYSYQYDRSIRIDFNQVFAILSNPTGIATDNAGNVYVIDDEDDKVKKFTTNGTFVKEWEIQRTDNKRQEITVVP